MSPLFSARLQIILPAVLLSCSGGAGYAVDLLKWDITGTFGTSGSGTATAVAAGVSGTGFTGGGANGNTTSPANTWNRTFSVVAPAVLPVDFATAMAAGHFFSFEITAAAGTTVSLSGMSGLNLSRTSTGPTTAGLFYSTDGTTYTQTGSTFTVTGTLTSAASAFDDTMEATPVVIPPGATVGWRIVAFGGSGNRFGLGKAATDDFILTGTAVSDVPVRNLRWTGAGGNDWNTVAGNQNWANPALANAPAAFAAKDNVTISLPAVIAVDPAGVEAGTVRLDNAAGYVSLGGGSISGLTLSKSAAGSASLAVSNSFSGGVVLTEGLLQIEVNGALGTGAVSINGGILGTIGDSSALGNPIILGNGGTTLAIDNNMTLSGILSTIGAPVNTANPLVKTGPGTLTLSSTNAAALGSQMVFDASGGAVEFDILAGQVVFSGPGTRNLGGTSTWEAPVTLGGGTLRLHGGVLDGSGGITVSANATILSRLNFGAATVGNPLSVGAGLVLTLGADNGGNLLIVNSPISGDGSLNKGGNGMVRLTGNNTYTGGTVLTSPTGGTGYFLQVGSDTALGTGPVTLNAGVTLAASGGARTLTNALVGAGDFALGGAGAALVLNGPVDLLGAVRAITLRNTTTLGGAISNGGINLVSANAALALNLAGTNTYTDGTTVSGGILRIQGNSSAATGPVLVQAGAALGGNGISGAAVTLAAGSSLTADLRDWTGDPGIGYDDLDVASLDAGSGPLTITLNAGALVNFTETSRTFPILRTTAGITNFNPATVTLATPEFPGTGSWTVQRAGNNLVLSYAAAAVGGYADWAAGPPWNLSGDSELPNADPDHDAIANAIEFVVGGNPATADDSGKLPVMTLDGTNLVFVFRRTTASAYLNPSVQYGSDPAGWTTATDGVAGVSVVVAKDGVEPGIDWVTVTIPRSPAAAGRLFARLRVLVP